MSRDEGGSGDMIREEEGSDDIPVTREITDIMTDSEFHLSQMNLRRRKIDLVMKLIIEDSKAADLKLSLYMAACNTYRYPTCLRPYPPGYSHETTTSHRKLVRLNEAIPSVQEMIEYYREPECSFHLDHNFIDVLYWLLVQKDNLSLISVKRKEHTRILSKVSKNITASPPTDVFEVKYDENSYQVRRWEKVKGDLTTNFGFHGSSLENFHSIIHHGLCQHLGSKEPLFGPGIYLTSDLSVSLIFGPFGTGWNRSMFGSKISVIALVEYINHPSLFKKMTDASKTEYTDLPLKYIVVPDADLIRIRYLLLYKENKAFPANAVSRWGNFNKTNIFWIVLALLVLLYGWLACRNWF